MASLFNKINRLKRQAGWSWEHFQREIDSLDADGVKPALLQSYYRSPHKKPTPHVSLLVNQLHNECFPSPFPESLDRWMHVYRELKASRRHITKGKNIGDLEKRAKQLLADLATADHLSEACLQWLLGNIEFDRIAPLLDSGECEQMVATKLRAIAHYQKVVMAIELHNREHPDAPVHQRHLYRAQHNILACYLNAVPGDQRQHDAATLEYLRESDYLTQCKKTVAAEHFQWGVARNGLRFSSLLQDVEEVKHFFSMLMAIHARFVDLSYEPFNQLSIAAIPDYQWAIKNVLTPTYLSSQAKALKKLKKEQRAKEKGGAKAA